MRRRASVVPWEVQRSSAARQGVGLRAFHLRRGPRKPQSNNLVILLALLLQRISNVSFLLLRLGVFTMRLLLLRRPLLLPLPPLPLRLRLLLRLLP